MQHAQTQNQDLKHHKCELIEGHRLFHLVQLVLHLIQGFLLDLLHLVLMLEVVLPQLRIKDFHLDQILYPLELVSYLVSMQKAGKNSTKPVFSFGLGSTAPFSFGSTQKEENTGAGVDDDGEGGNYSDDQASSDEDSDRGNDSSQTSKEGKVADDGEEGEKRNVCLGKGLPKGWKSEKDSWECTICLVRNKSEKLECAACASPKAEVDVNRKKTTEGKPLFGFGSGSSFSSAGFSFGFWRWSFLWICTDIDGGRFSFGFNGQSDGDEEGGDERQKGVGKGLLKRWKPEEGS